MQKKLIKHEYVKNASIYSDMQELMVAADMPITDYSSTMFEFSMMKKSVFCICLIETHTIEVFTLTLPNYLSLSQQQFHH